MMALLRPMRQYASMIAQLREVPISESHPHAFQEAFAAAMEGAKNDRLDMVVGLQQNDDTGEPEWGFCPLLSVGPAFVIDVRYLITAEYGPFVFLVGFNPVPAAWVELEALDEARVAAIQAGQGYGTAQVTRPFMTTGEVQ